jgi:mannitol/fructose-specific phosphotransferase system IIA component (Ntr-type)
MGRPMTNQEFLSLFEEQLYIQELDADNKKEVLEEFVELLHKEGRIVDKEIVLDMLLRRENLGSTALGKGLAIPHGRTLTTRNLVVAVGKCTQGLDFKAPDGEPVHLFFLIIAPYRDKQNMYLPTLGKIAEFFRKEEMKEKILQVSCFEEFLDVLSAEAESS